MRDNFTTFFLSNLLQCRCVYYVGQYLAIVSALFIISIALVNVSFTDHTSHCCFVTLIWSIIQISLLNFYQPGPRFFLYKRM